MTHQREKFVVTLHGKPVAVLGPIESDKPKAGDLATLLEELCAFRASVVDRGPIREPDETWKDFVREGLD